MPIEVPFIEQIEIAINRKLFSRLEREFNTINYNYLNLFKYSVEKINFLEGNINSLETVKFESSVDFFLYGIGVTELNEEEKNIVKVDIYKDNSLLINKCVFSQDDEEMPLSIGFFDSPIKIERDIEYTIKFKDIFVLLFIPNYQEYNQNSKIRI